MINPNGIILNNMCVGEFLKTLKNSEKQYKTLSKLEERRMIDKYMNDGKESELRELLVMHNIRLVFSIAKRYCKSTRDFDNMFSKGIYGLVYAANKFDLYKPITKNVVVDHVPLIDEETGTQKIDKETGLPIERPITVKQVVINPITCKPDYVKFCTYANSWIFKYIVDEFGKKSNIIDNNSISIDDKVKIKNSFDNNQTMENYIDEMVSPDYYQPKTMEDTMSDVEVSRFYECIEDYLNNTNELTALEKKIIIDTYYHNKKLKEIAIEMNEKPVTITATRDSALDKIRMYLSKTYNVTNMSDIIK